jgi:hypothetical protein
MRKKKKRKRKKHQKGNKYKGKIVKDKKCRADKDYISDNGNPQYNHKVPRGEIIYLKETIDPNKSKIGIMSIRRYDSNINRLTEDDNCKRFYFDDIRDDIGGLLIYLTVKYYPKKSEIVYEHFDSGIKVYPLKQEQIDSGLGKIVVQEGSDIKESIIEHYKNNKKEIISKYDEINKESN